MDKIELKEKLMALERAFLEQAEGSYEEYLGESQWDDEEVIDDDVHSHKAENAEITGELEQQVLDHAEHLRILEAMDFSPSDTIRPGAVVKLNGRYMVVAVSRPKFEFRGKAIIGISTEAPIYRSMQGKKAGDAFTFNGTRFRIEEVH